MKLKFTLFALFIISNTASAQLPPNLGFEDWTTNSNGWLDPDGWWSSNSPAGVSSMSVERITGRTGYGLRLKKVSEPTAPLGVMGGLIQYKSPIVTYQSIELKGYWKGNFNSGNDNIKVEIEHYDSLNNHVVTFNTSTGITASLSSWVPFSRTMGGDGGKKWKYVITLQYYYGNNALSSTMRGEFDDLTMDVVTSTGELISIDLMRNFSLITKQPLKEYALKMDLLKPSELKIDLIDVQGRIVSSSVKEFDAGNFEYPIDLSGVADGLYLCRVQSGNKASTLKLIKNSN